MIKNIENDKEKEYDFITKCFEVIERVMDDSHIQQFITVKGEYLSDLEWSMDHIYYDSKDSLKRLNSINYEVVHSIHGFASLIDNQDNLKLKNEMIECFLKKLRSANLKLKKLFLSENGND